MNDDLLYKLALTQISGIGSVLSKSLIGYCGGVKSVFNTSLSRLEKTPGVGSKLAYNIHKFRDFTRIEEELRFIEKHKIEVLFYLDEHYPVRLKNIPDAPVVLFKKGKANLSPPRIIAIVGTRKMSSYGKTFLSNLIQELSGYNVTIVSGLAYGVDIWAHRLCIKHEIVTCAVLAHGLDRLYPSVHSGTAANIGKGGGALLCEHFSGTNPDRENFPKRNRIVAGLVDAVIVVESGEKGGSIITADLANQYNRDVLALPGNIDQRNSKGCNWLIKNHKAHVIEDISDLVKILNWDIEAPQTKQAELFVELNDDERNVLNLIREQGIVRVDELMIKTRQKTSQIATSLLELEMKNCIVALPGKRYKAV